MWCGEFEDEANNVRQQEAVQAVIWGTAQLDLGTVSSSPSHDDSNDGSLVVAVFANVVLLRKLRLVHGEYVQVHVADQPDDKQHIGRIFATSFEKHNASSRCSQNRLEEASNKVLLSPLLAFNLGLPLNPRGATQSPRVFLTRLRTKDSSSLATRLLSAKPQDARKAIIAPLLLSSVSCQQHAVLRQPDGLLSALRQFFAVPQLLQIGDVFGVPVEEVFYPIDHLHISRKGVSTYESTELSQTFAPSSEMRSSKSEEAAAFQCVTPPQLPVDCRMVFFRVESVGSASREPEEALFVSDATELLQSSPVTCAAPDEHVVKRFCLDAPSATRGQSVPEIPSIACDPHALNRLYTLLYPSQVSQAAISVLLSGPRGVGKSTLVHQVAKELGAFVVEVAFTELTANSELLLLENLKGQMLKASSLAPCVLYLSRFFSVEKDNEEADVRIGAVITECLRALAVNGNSDGMSIPLVADVEDVNEIPKFVRQSFLYEMHLEAPNQEDRLRFLRQLTRDVQLDEQVDLKHVAQLTAGRSCSELSALVADAAAHALERLEAGQQERLLLDQLMVMVESNSELNTASLGGPALSITSLDFEKAIQLQLAQSSTKTSTASIPNVKWEDVGGLEDVKEEILDVVQLPIQHPELFASGVRQRSGILLYGPPGTGKTLLAKAIATECNLNFLSVKGPELLNMYIGESEKNVRQVFAKARSCRPCILFFDELDSLAPMRGRGSDSGGVMDRVVSQLLTEIDGLQSQNGNDQVFVIGATNRPDLIESGLLRPGRFDRLLYLGICQDPKAKKKVIQALTHKFSLAKDVDLDHLVDLCASNFTGADYYALCSIALSLALKDRVAQLDQQVEQLNAQDCYSSTRMTVRTLLNTLDKSELLVPVAQNHFEQALKQVHASVSTQELVHYEHLKLQYSSTQTTQLQ